MAKQEFTSEPVVDPKTLPPPAPVPVWDENGRLTYQSMVDIVKGGGSVRIAARDGTPRIINSLLALPNEVQYAATGGDRAAVGAATAAQQQRIDQMQAELDSFKKAAVSQGAVGQSATGNTTSVGQSPQAGQTATVGAQVNPDDSPVSATNADEAIETISRMRSRDKLQHVIDNDERVTVKEAARKRLDAISA